MKHITVIISNRNQIYTIIQYSVFTQRYRKFSKKIDIYENFGCKLFAKWQIRIHPRLVISVKQHSFLEKITFAILLNQSNVSDPLVLHLQAMDMATFSANIVPHFLKLVDSGIGISCSMRTNLSVRHVISDLSMRKI
jgi:hypothetical protein